MEDSALFIAYLRTAPVLASAALPLCTAATHTTDSAVVSAVSRSSNPGTNSRPASGKRCYNCQRYGHIAQFCNYAPAGNFAPNPVPRPPPAPPGTLTPSMSVVRANTGHNAAQPFRAPQRNSVRHTQFTNFCFDWNNTGQCQQGCQGDHRCSWCTWPHPRCQCPTYPPNQQ